MCLARHFSTQTPNAVDLSTKCHPGKSVSGRRELKYVQILSQNTQGLNTDKEEMILDVMKQKNIFAYSSLTIISSPITSRVPQRCSRRLAAKAEQAGGRLVYSHTDTPRVIRDNLHPTVA